MHGLAKNNKNTANHYFFYQKVCRVIEYPYICTHKEIRNDKYDIYSMVVA